MARAIFRRSRASGQLFDVAFLAGAGLRGAVPADLAEDRRAVAGGEAARRRHLYGRRGRGQGVAGLSWEKLGQNPTMQAQWEKLGYTKETAADIITQPFDYTIDTAGVVVTGMVIVGYFFFCWSCPIGNTDRSSPRNSTMRTDRVSLKGDSTMWDILGTAAWVASGRSSSGWPGISSS